MHREEYLWPISGLLWTIPDQERQIRKTGAAHKVNGHNRIYIHDIADHADNANPGGRKAHGAKTVIRSWRSIIRFKEI